MGKLAWQNPAAYFTAFCLSVHAAPSQVPSHLCCYPLKKKHEK